MCFTRPNQIEKLFEKSKVPDEKVACTEKEGVELIMESYYSMDQSTVNSAFFKTGLNKFKNFRLINNWSQEQQKEYLLNESYEQHRFFRGKLRLLIFTSFKIRR